LHSIVANKIVLSCADRTLTGAYDFTTTTTGTSLTHDALTLLLVFCQRTAMTFKSEFV
jgi:hypothetical protein